MKKLKGKDYYLIDEMKRVVPFIIAIILSSCTSKTILEKPKDLIPKDTMVLLYTDLYIARSAIHEKNSNNERNVNYMPLVYKKYLIDSTRYKRSNFYYTSKLVEYDIIFKKVRENLLLKTSELQEKLKINKETVSPNQFRNQ